MEQVEGARDAARREVRVGGRERHRAVVRAGVDLQPEVVARAEHVLLRDAEAQRNLVGRGVARAELQRARGLLGHGDVQVDLVVAARHFGGLDIHVGEEAQAVHAVARELDLRAVVPGAFVLAELAPDHLVARARIAADVQPPHIGTPPGLGVQHHHHAAPGAVDLGLAFHAREGVAEGAEVVGKGLGGGRHVLAVVGRAGAHGDERLELVLAPQVVACQLHARHRELLALADVHRELQRLPVGRDRDLRRLDAELEVAARQVERAQRFQVGVELAARVLVRLRVPGQPAAVVLVEQVEQRAFVESLLPDHTHPRDARRLALGHAEREVDPVALQRRDGGDHLRVVEAAADVLALELLLGTVGQRLVVRPAFGQPDVAQRLLQRRLVELLGAREVDVGDGGALFDDDHEHMAIDVDAHVLEQSEIEQRADGRAAAVVAVRVAGLQAEGREHRARFDALQAFEADVLHGERVGCLCRAGRHREAQRGKGREGLGRNRHHRMVFTNVGGMWDALPRAGPVGEQSLLQPHRVHRRPRHRRPFDAFAAVLRMRLQRQIALDLQQPLHRAIDRLRVEQRVRARRAPVVAHQARDVRQVLLRDHRSRHHALQLHAFARQQHEVLQPQVVRQQAAQLRRLAPALPGRVFHLTRPRAAMQPKEPARRRLVGFLAIDERVAPGLDLEQVHPRLAHDHRIDARRGHRATGGHRDDEVAKNAQVRKRRTERRGELLHPERRGDRALRQNNGHVELLRSPEHCRAFRRLLVNKAEPVCLHRPSEAMARPVSKALLYAPRSGAFRGSGLALV
ncbi:hypothetical protein FQZ97_642070 [compost metagenome]